MLPSWVVCAFHNFTEVTLVHSATVMIFVAKILDTILYVLCMD